MSDAYLLPGLAAPQPTALDEPYWNGLKHEQLHVQHCSSCGTWQWGPEWICHGCLSDGVEFTEIQARGIIYSYERVWHPVHPALKDQGPYIVVLVELPHAGGVRMVGNLLGDPQQDVVIGASVDGVFEHHTESQPSYTLLHWAVQ